MSKLLAVIVAAMFTVATAGTFAADSGTPTKDAPKVDCKDAKNKDHKDCKAEMKK